MSDFKAMRKKRNSLEKLTAQIEKATGKNRGNDNENEWRLERDKSGNGYAVIRFLPEPPGEDVPFVTVYSHGFQGPGGWYIEKSLTTLGQEDPVSAYNSKLWNTGIEKNKEIARSQKRRTSFYANIYVINDPMNPENNGKVFVYRFGKTVMNLIEEAVSPQFKGEVPIDPFSFDEGANFILKVRTADGYPKYDRCEFGESGPLKNPDNEELSDEELEEIWNSQHSLQAYVDPSSFKSYEELQARMNRVLQLDQDDEDEKPAGTRRREVEEEEDSEDILKSKMVETSDDEDDDDTMEFFKKLAEE